MGGENLPVTRKHSPSLSATVARPPSSSGHVARRSAEPLRLQWAKIVNLKFKSYGCGHRGSGRTDSDSEVPAPGRPGPASHGANTVLLTGRLTQ